MRGKILIYTVGMLLMLTACHNHHDDEDDIMPERTVLVYMSGENNLSGNLADDLLEMLAAKTDKRRHCLLAYIDDRNTKNIPYLVRIVNGQKTDSVSLRDMGIGNGNDTSSVAPGVMRDVINYAFRKYPSQTADYGLVLWGHATGWTVEEDSIATKPAAARRRAYGLDNGTDSKDGKASWINIHTMADVLKQVPHLKFIFADCCNFQCLESLYALRNVADYIIGSPAEIPDVGAPYVTVVPAMFERDSFYVHIIDRYFERTFGQQRRVPLSAVKTSAMNAVAVATRDILQTIKDTLSLTPYPNTAKLIHYYYSPLHYDANDFMLRYAKKEAYDKWKAALDEAVVYKKMATTWMTNVAWYITYTDFEMTEERYGGVSMFVPQNPAAKSNYGKYNADIRTTAWYYATEMKDLGW